MKRLSIGLKERKKGIFPIARAGIILFVATLLLAMPMYAVEALSAPSGSLDFEIPINELSREQKESPPKHTARKPQKRKKSAAGSRRSTTRAVASTQRADRAKTVVTAPRELPLASDALQPFRIFTVPYSFVVIGKSTVIKAVIYREADDLQAVNCKIRGVETGTLSLVKMAKVDGFRFTYSATLPEVATDAASLRYTIIATELSGTDSISPEFTSPVTFSPLVPGWQF